MPGVKLSSKSSACAAVPLASAASEGAVRPGPIQRTERCAAPAWPPKAAVTAAVVLRLGGSVAGEELSALVKAHKGSVQAPKHVHFVDAIPQTAVGKPDKKALRVKFG